MPGPKDVAYVDEWRCEERIFLVIEKFEFPCDTEKKLDRVERRACMLDQDTLLFSRRIECLEDVFEEIEKECVNLCPECIP